jgi:DNA-binding XRE family transcriptional regulator
MQKTYRGWREKALKDPDVKRAYDRADDDPFIEVAHLILACRKRANITQAQLAKRVGTSQQAIARLESLDYRGYTLTTLAKVAEALDKKLKVTLVPA